MILGAAVLVVALVLLFQDHRPRGAQQLLLGLGVVLGQIPLLMRSVRTGGYVSLHYSGVVAMTTLLALQLAMVAFDGGPVWVRLFFGLLPPLTIGLGITYWRAVLRHRLPAAPPGP